MRILFFSIFLLASAMVEARSHLVVAPHPDDELLIAAGTMYGAVKRGEKVQVVVLTNGDAFGYKRGKTATFESVQGLAVIGVPENQIFFLGYGDQLLARLWPNIANPNDVLKSDAGLTMTEAFYGFGKSAYHKALFGVNAPYSRNSFIQDLQLLITNEQPTDIYAVLPEDTHPDHWAGTRFLFEVLNNLKTTRPSYRPQLHLTIVHVPGQDLVWPGEIHRPDLMFTEPAFVQNSPYKWSQIESIPVPPEMLVMDKKKNLKYLAIDKHKSKTKHDKFLYRFIRANEFFWKF